jgi:hypothetical protein
MLMLRKEQDYHLLEVLVIIKRNYLEYFEKVDSKEAKDLVVLVKKTASVGWSTRVPLDKVTKEVTRNVVC